MVKSKKTLDEGILKKLLPGLCAIGIAASMGSCKDNTVKYGYKMRKFDKATNQAIEPRNDWWATTFLSFDHKLSPSELEDIRKKLDQQYNDKFAEEGR